MFLFNSDQIRQDKNPREENLPCAPVYKKNLFEYVLGGRIKEAGIYFLQAERKKKETMEELLLTGELDELMELCEKNGRVLIYSEDGVIITFDEYQWTDKQTFKSIDEAVKWERGYQR
jgi:hypothetical protein